MERRSGRAHQDRCFLERNLVRQTKHVAFRHTDQFRITAVTMFPDHLAGRTKLFAIRLTREASATGDKIVDANTIAPAESTNIRTHFFDRPTHFMSESNGKGLSLR